MSSKATSIKRLRKLPAVPPHALDWAPHENAALPVVGVAVDFAAGQEVELHSHAQCQLLYAVQGVLEVRTPHGRWLVPPSKAVWLTPFAQHSLHMRGAVRVRSLLVNRAQLAAAEFERLPQRDCVMPVSALLRALISEVAHWPVDGERGRREQLLVALLLEELGLPDESVFHLPWPENPRLARLCEQLQDEPGSLRTAERCAADLAMSSKTFHRHFEKATGMGFGRWRQRARLLVSLPLLLAGRPVVEVALHVGYESHSAYSLAFKMQMGVSPSRFVAQSRTGET